MNEAVMSVMSEGVMSVMSEGVMSEGVMSECDK